MSASRKEDNRRTKLRSRQEREREKGLGFLRVRPRMFSGLAETAVLPLIGSLVQSDAPRCD